MSAILDKNVFLVKEHTGIFKAANNFDIHDPENGEIVMECREDNLGFFTRMLRFTDYKRNTPFGIQVRTPNGAQVIRVTRGISILRSKVKVLDENDAVIDGFHQKLFSIGGAFTVMDAEDNPVCTLKGKWTGWDFRFLAGEKELAHVTKKWAGIGKELFTSADNYVITIAESVPPGSVLRKLILASVLCIDMVLKE
ncbi:MAG: RNAase [Candidatus Hydrogenedentes bacterium]|nr:RNAase [Candidatus Hydrogenedentota bacterium]